MHRVIIPTVYNINRTNGEEYLYATLGSPPQKQRETRPPDARGGCRAIKKKNARLLELYIHFDLWGKKNKKTKKKVNPPGASCAHSALVKAFIIHTARALTCPFYTQ